MDTTKTRKFQNFSNTERQKIIKSLLQRKKNTNYIISPRSNDRNPPLSFNQQRLWFLQKFDETNTVYNLVLSYQLKGRLNIFALQQSFELLIQKHESLRTNIQMHEHSPVQVVNVHSIVILPIIEINEADIILEIQKEQNHVFDLSEDPLFRGKLLTISLEHHILIINMHHILSDGWSLGIIMKEIQANYRHFTTNSPLIQPSLTIQYADFVVWQRKLLNDQALNKKLTFWKEYLKDSTTLLNLPLDKPRPKISSYNGRRKYFELSPKLTEELNLLNKQQEVTPFMTFLATFFVFLARYSNQKDILLGTPVAGRNHPDTENLIGFFINTVVLRLQFEKQDTFTDVLQRIKQNSLQAFKYQDYPLDHLVNEFVQNRSLDYSPLFQVMFAFQNVPNPMLHFDDDLEVISRPLEHPRTEFDLSLFITEEEGIFKGRFEYKSDLFDDDTIENMVEHFLTLLGKVTHTPQSQVFQIPMLTEEERHYLLYSSNDTQKDIDTSLLIHQWLEIHSTLFPHQEALNFEGTSLTFEDLNRKTNQVAHYLIEKGIKPGQFVGVYCLRSLEMVIAIHGIMKAGAAYVPLDPSLPEKRIKHILFRRGY